MTSIKIKFRPSSIQEKKGVLFFSVIHKRQNRQITTRFRLFPEEWDTVNGCIRMTNSPRKQELTRIRQRLSTEVGIIERIIKYFEQNGTPYTAHQIIETYKSRLFSGFLFPFLEQQYTLLNTQGRHKTSNSYLCTLRSFRSFRNNADIEIAAIDSATIKAYENWLKTRGLTLNTISYYMRTLRAAYNKAAEQGLTPSSHPFRHVYTGIEKTRKRAVDETVISRLKKARFSNRSLEQARDLFLFSFYTRGMSFVDMAHLTKENIHNGNIIYKRRKTGQILRIKLEKCISEIIERYRHHTSGTPYILPIIRSGNPRPEEIQYDNALRYHNILLKKISEELRLPVPLTSYVARHSWATIAKKKNIPIAIISEGMGHESENTTQIYLGSLDQSVVDKANRLILYGIK